MALQNGVDPWGNIVANPARGTRMGNRGILHNENRQVTRPFNHQNWVICKLQFKGVKRKLMSPGNYTELFFLDEATAFAAGHRPCNECSRERYVAFKDYWVRANLGQESKDVKVAEITKVMHRERISRREKVTYKATLEELPDGAFFSFDDSAYILFGSEPYLWIFDEYRLPIEQNFPEEVEVLTPESVVKAFKLGLKPDIHESISALK